jgi:dolichol kinase
MESYLFILLIFAITYPIPMVIHPGLVRVFQVESPEIRRKISHICYGLLFCFYPLISWNLIIPILALLLVFVAHASFLFSDNAVKRLNIRMGSKGSNPQSAICFYIGFLLLYILFTEQYLIYLASALVLTFGDAFAAIAGQKTPIKHYKIFGAAKSLGGSLAFFATAFLILFLFMVTTTPIIFSLAVLFSLGLAGALTIVENLTPYRMDNLTILLATAYLYQYVLTTV